MMTKSNRCEDRCSGRVDDKKNLLVMTKRLAVLDQLGRLRVDTAIDPAKGAQERSGE